MEIAQMLEQRRNQHGDLIIQSGISQNMKDIMRDSWNWDNLQTDQKECLEMVVHKVARILAGDPNFADHWEDVAGYAILVANRLKPVKP